MNVFAGRYLLLSSLGRGAQGLALRVADTLAGDRPAVLKLGLSGREDVDGTIAEFESLASIVSPSIAPVLELGFASRVDVRKAMEVVGEGASSEGVSTRPYLVRAWVDGPDILTWASQAETTLEDALTALALLAEAVDQLHRVGVLHGDIKPDHVLVTTDGAGRPRPVLIDFGLASRGVEGTRGGTPGYLAPERLRGQRATMSSDRFAFGVVAVQTLLGRREGVRAATGVEQLPPGLEGVPARALQGLRRLLDPDPAQRAGLDATITALIPADRVTEGFGVSVNRQLPFLGHGRLRLVDQLAGRATRQPGTVTLLVGDRGAGRSRSLQKLAWSLQSLGVPTLHVLDATAPWRRLIELGPRLAALEGRTFDAPDPRDVAGDRPHWLRNLAESLAEAAPAARVAIAWDDIGEDLIDGLDGVEAMALLLERLPGRLHLYATATPDRVARLESMFAAVGVEAHVLERLSRDDLDGLAGPPLHLGRNELDRLYERSGGLPARLRRLVFEDTEEVEAGHEDWVQALVGLLPGGASVAELLRAAEAVGLERRALHTLLARHLAGARLAVTTSADSAHTLLYTARVPRLEDLPPQERQLLGQALAAVAHHHPQLAILAAAFERDEARLLEAWSRHGQAFLELQSRALVLTLLEPALAVTASPTIIDAYTDAALDSGQFGRARAALARTRTLTPLPATGVRARLLQLAEARLAFAAGDIKAASALLEGPGDDLPTLHAAHAAHVLAQVELRSGDYAGARGRAEAAAGTLASLALPAAVNLRAQLAVLAAAAAAFLGEQASQDLDETLDLKALPPRIRARYHALRAVAAYMRGHVDEATDRYRAALDIVEQEGLDEDRPLYLLNLGTAFERQVRLSMAREYYNFGIRSCTPSTRPSTRALLLANRANVDIKLGRTAEARELLAAAGRIARAAALDAIARFVSHLEADADAVDGRLDAALTVYARCAESYADGGDLRHAVELHLKAGLAAIRGGDATTSRRHFERAEADVGDFPDLKPLAAILLAELTIARGGIDVMAGVDRYLRALEQALEANDDLTVLTEALGLDRALDRTGHRHDPLAEQQLRAITGRAWRRVAIALTPELRGDFARHLGLDVLDTGPQQPGYTLPTMPGGPEARGAVPGSAPRLPDPGHSRPALQTRYAEGVGEEVAHRFYRMLSLNRRILGETDLERLIPAALDIAIELAGAERGFLLLRERADGPFEVAFSRDVDGRAISEAHLQVSSTVAMQVVDSGQPVVAVDAGLDGRLQHAVSVHKLQLTAVLCVPITDRDEVLGCLYLDHRSSPGAFDAERVRMIAAYADQVAIALVVARQVQALRGERDELRKARTRIEDLLAEKEELLTDLRTRCDHLEAEVARERHHTGLRYDYGNIIAHAPAMRAVFEQVDRVVGTTLPVVVHGESGTGKELIARAIHFNGPRQRAPFVAVNCGALAETLLESELFGHKKGAFTGANTDRQGLFEAAHGGTLFLDEVGEMSLGMQVKLLRALQEGRVRPVGATREVEVDVRVIAATHRDLGAMMAAAAFRQDLFYRLATLIIRLPPLRERREDIPLLVRHFLQVHCERAGSAEPEVGGDALQVLMGADWPGNIRQLENIVRAATVLGGARITGELLLTLLHGQHTRASGGPSGGPGAAEGVRVGRPRKCSREEVRQALARFGAQRQAAADHLGISTRTLQRYLQKFDLG